MSKAPSRDHLESLLDYCQTATQHQYLSALMETGSSRKAAKLLGVSKSTINDTVARVKAYAALKGWSPTHDMIFSVPDNFLAKRISTNRNGQGEVISQWVIAEPEKQTIEQQLREMFAVFKQDIPHQQPVTPPTPALETDIIPWVNIGDAHLGMLAAAEEVGEDFDLKIAEAELCKAFSLMLSRLPTTERIVINDLGDMTHTEVNSNRTEASGHALDVDGRYYKIFRVYLRVMRYLIREALTKYEHVDVIINQGNHSRTNDMAMVAFLQETYIDEPRLTVLDNSSVFIPYRMGNTFVLCHHGDKARMDKLTNVMVSDYRHEMDAKYKYIFTGHIHNNKVLAESHGIVVESFNQLAAPDKYAHEGGWRSRKCITAVLLSKTYGETGRITIPVEEVKDILANLVAGTSANKRKKVYTV